MTVEDQSKLMMLSEQTTVELGRTDCWKQSKSHWYYKWRMENVKCCWTFRTPVAILILIVFNLCLVAFTLAAPTTRDPTTTAPPQQATTDLPTVNVPSTGENSVVHKPPTLFDPTRPTPLSFIKNAKCKLHKQDGKTIPRRCGLRELDLPDNESGVRYWNPQTCSAAHCQCVATKEIRRKEKRSVANNKTIIEYRRYKLFECV